MREEGNIRCIGIAFLLFLSHYPPLMLFLFICNTFVTSLTPLSLPGLYNYYA